MKTPEQDLKDKARFDYLKSRGIRGLSNRLVNPYSGKNSAQRQRLNSAFGNFRHTKKQTIFSDSW